jgi:hypothetical protein
MCPGETPPPQDDPCWYLFHTKQILKQRSRNSGIETGKDAPSRDR